MIKKFLNLKPTILLAIAAVLLLASTVGSTQAALTYYSENYSAEVTVSNIGVTLMENGEAISRRNYIGTDLDAPWDEATGTLFTNLLQEDEKIALGKAYPEELVVRNSGAIDTYVRVILTKSWLDTEGRKDPSLSPDLIELNLVTGGNGWVVDESASTAERTVLYYTNILESEEDSPAFTDFLRIDPALKLKVSKTVKNTAEGEIISYVYEYDGYTFQVEAEINAVQVNSAQEAIKSAWGVDVNVAEDGSLSLQ